MKQLKTTSTPEQALKAKSFEGWLSQLAENEVSEQTAEITEAMKAIVGGAEGATKLLPFFEAKRSKLLAEAGEIDTTIARLKAMIAVADQYRSLPVYQALPDGAAGPDIDQMLFDNAPQALKVAELQTMIKERCFHEWATSTIANHLSRGKAKGLYSNDGGAWQLTDKGMAEML